nr:hypothetical protein [Tanacetum cinerariifolium]
MAALRYRDEHNKVGYLLKPTGSDDYHQIIDFLRASHIRYALTHDLVIFDSLIKQFWSTATLKSPELADDGGIDDFPIAEIYSGMNNLGTKSGSWDQFGSPLVVALICLSGGRQFNLSSYIFKGMASNIGNAKKFLMYHIFLQTILGIETHNKRQYKVLRFYSKLFSNMRLNFEGHPMPLLAAMLSQDKEGEGAGVAAQAVPQHMHAPDQPQDLLSTPPRQQTFDLTALVFEQDEPLGGSFHMSPPRSTQAPVQKVNSLETKLKDHKKLFKDVVGKLVKMVKAMKVKLKTSKRKLVVNDSDQEEGGKQDVDLEALLALANAVVTVDSKISPGGAFDNPVASTSVPVAVPTGASNVPTGSTCVPANVPIGVAPPGVSNKGKAPMVKEDIPVKERSFKQIQEDILGEQDAKRLHDEEQAHADRQRAELMAALIKMKKQVLAEKLAQERKDRPMTQGQQRTYMRQFVKIKVVLSILLDGVWLMTLKRTVPVIEEPSSKRQKSTEAPISSMPEAPPSPVTFIKVVSNKDFEDEAPRLWSALVGWEVITTPLGDINALYRIDRSTAYFTALREILHMVLFYSHKGEVVFMFANISYPLSVKLMERMLTHKLEIDKDVVGKDITTAEQLIGFIKNQLVATQGDVMIPPKDYLAQEFFNVADFWCSSSSMYMLFSLETFPDMCRLFKYVVPTGRIVVPTGRYVVRAGNVIVVSTGRRYRFLLTFSSISYFTELGHLNNTSRIWEYVRVVDGTDDREKGAKSMKEKVSQENVCEEEVPLNNNIGKLSGDLVEMQSEAVEHGMDDHVPNEIDGAES